jgi:hypothetical protein
MSRVSQMSIEQPVGTIKQNVPFLPISAIQNDWITVKHIVTRQDCLRMDVNYFLKIIRTGTLKLAPSFFIRAMENSPSENTTLIADSFIIVNATDLIELFKKTKTAKLHHHNHTFLKHNGCINGSSYSYFKQPTL